MPLDRDPGDPPAAGDYLVLSVRGGFGRSQAQSFPRKRESTPPAIGNAPPTDWITASAGMTKVSKGISFQMTPLPEFRQSIIAIRRPEDLFRGTAGQHPERAGATGSAWTALRIACFRLSLLRMTCPCLPSADLMAIFDAGSDWRSLKHSFPDPEQGWWDPGSPTCRQWRSNHWSSFRTAC
jgi:hypothetical protein